MKPRIFIAAHYMNIGGAEISLIGLLQAIDYSKYDVDLFVYSHEGELMEFIPKEVNLLPEIKAYSDVEKPLKGVLFSSSWRIALVRLWCKLLKKQYQKKHGTNGVELFYDIFEKKVTPFLPSLKKYGMYDLAINFIGNANVILDKVDAKKRVSWIHTDYTSISVIPELGLPTYNRLDYVASISKASTTAFLKVFPALKDKMVDIENILSPKFVRMRGDLESVNLKKDDKEIVLLSVGRFCEAKNYDNVPDICKKILQRLEVSGLAVSEGDDALTTNQAKRLTTNLNLKWYIIGFGPDEALIRNKIAEAGMEDYVIILGKKANPYPYIKACDWYVQPSRYEGKSVTVREAQMLCKPVIIANYTTAKSQVQDGVDGVIVPQENESCAEAMAKVIVDKDLHSKIENYLSTHDFGNESEVEKVYKLID